MAVRIISRIGNKNALTLIEVMIAVIILTVGIIGIIQAYIKSLDVLQISKDYLAEVPLAENKMAEIQREEVANRGLAQTKISGKFQSPYDNFNWEMEINPSDITGLNTVKIKCFNGTSFPIREFILISYAKNK